ncbi:MAG: hypothetical protein ACP5JH_04495 [Bacteroidota bacterium]
MLNLWRESAGNRVKVAEVSTEFASGDGTMMVNQTEAGHKNLQMRSGGSSVRKF